MEFNMNQTKTLAFLKEILTTPSPTGYMPLIVPKVKSAFEALGYQVTNDKKGNILIRVPGDSSEKTIGLSGHLDTLGAMVRSIKDNGKLRITTIGGYAFSTVEGEYCLVHPRNGKAISGTVLTTSPSVHVNPDAKTQERSEENMEIRLDERVSTKAEVESLGIRVGDYISFDPRTEILDNGYIKSRHLDDKAGVATIYAYLEFLSASKKKPAYDLVVLLSTYEEVGHGASHIPKEVDELLAVDMGAMGLDLGGHEEKVSICAKDSSGPYDYDMTGKLIALADEHALSYVIDVFPFYGSDVSAALRGGNDLKGALIGPGVHASHGMERTHIKAIEDSAHLMFLYCQSV